MNASSTNAWTAEQAVGYIHSARNNRGKNGLSNIVRLCELLGNPERGLRAVHVAGTNGKGSVCACLDAILRAAGYSVGLYTSPYLQRYAERVRINGTPISDAAFLSAFYPVYEATERLRAEGIWPTFFEIGTALAFTAFAQAGVNLCVVEVGLGGRLDPTNVLMPLVCAVTAIALDHQAQLGDTLTAIAGEKAGIIKPRVPVVTAAQASPDIDAVFAARAAQSGSPWHPLSGCEMMPLYPDDSPPERSPLALGVQHAVFSCGGWHIPRVRLRLLGAHQLRNAALALAVIARLRESGLNIPDEAALHGLEIVRWPGRLEYAPGRPGILLDGAHNAQALRALADFVREPNAVPDYPHVLLCGAMAEHVSTQSVDTMAELAPLAITVAPVDRRAMPSGELATMLAERGAQVESHTDIHTALAKARSYATPSGTVITTGSLYLVGEVRAQLCAEGMIADEI